jgi:ATP-dependent Lhr-like helicase
VRPFDHLHPALQHHIVNTLAWRSLRLLQEEAIEPILAGDHVILQAPTAGGKTEAALFPVLSRMLHEGWEGLSVLYVCPIKALLNNLEVRLQQYCGLLGRRAELWHGDVGDGARRRIGADPPDLLLTTPESIEVMLVSRRTDRTRLFRDVQVVIVDELHAFAGDDRGWHLLAVLERVSRLAGRNLQRLGLSATVGNPDELLEWLSGSSSGARRVVAPPTVGEAPGEVALDFVGTLENAATVISRLHAGEKRLVFCDSRSRVEQLATHLRQIGVDTYVSHSSLSLDERRQAEQAFAGGRDCVIVATSTLELGIDVGDLDHVIQIDAPSSVSGFLQRLGRTGRRLGTVRNCLFLATSDESLLRAAALIQLWSEGFVEPVIPPPEPYHILAQQLMALALQEGGIGRARWREWIGGMPGFASMAEPDVCAIEAHMIDRGILFNENGILSIGPEGERSFGYKNFMELFSVFTSPPLFTVLSGRNEIGKVHESSFQVRRGEAPVLLLGGRSWRVVHVDWEKGLAYVEPTMERGRSRWLGAGEPLHFQMCQAIRRVLLSGSCPGQLSQRATARLGGIRDEFPWLEDEDSTVIVRDIQGGLHWWTFGGLIVNAGLAEWLEPEGRRSLRRDNLWIELEADADRAELEDRIAEAHGPNQTSMWKIADEKALDGLKFGICVPRPLVERMMTVRLADRVGLEFVLSQGIHWINTAAAS